jgi:hypothetical protein
MAYVYRHIRHDKNIPFYIGVGLSDKNYFRAYQKSKSKRSEYWHNISQNGYDVEILMDGLTKEQAFEKEKEFIKLYGRKNNNTGILCNMTDGGENPPINVGDKNPAKRKEVREKLSKQRIGIKLTNEHRKNLSISSIRSGKKPPSRKGKKMSRESVNKMIKSRFLKGSRRKVIYQYDELGNFIKEWKYSKDIKILNPKFSLGNIQSVCRGIRKIAYGYIWSYEDARGRG